MNIDFDLIKFICIVATGCSVLTTPTVQKIKSKLKSKKYLEFISFLVSMVIGVLFTLSFTSSNYIVGLWVGYITYLGASGIYLAFENKLFTPYSEMNKPSDPNEPDDEIIIDRGGE